MINSFVALDFEFGEVKQERISIVEIGLQKVENGKFIKEFSMLINPESAIDSYASDNIHHIYQSDVRTAPTFETVWPDIMEFIGTNPVVVHDAKNERKAILSNIAYYDLTLDNLVLFDTLKLAKSVLPENEKYNISSLSEFLKLPKLVAHDALADAQETAQLFMELQKRISKNTGIMKQIKSVISLA